MASQEKPGRPWPPGFCIYGVRKMNQIMVIHPYKSDGLWVFDDEKVGLIEEPFVSGADEIISLMVAGMDDAEQGFSLLFSANPFPGYQLELRWLHEEYDGHWYYAARFNKQGWLCPALFKYFDAAPRRLYAQFKAKS